MDQPTRASPPQHEAADQLRLALHPVALDEPTFLPSAQAFDRLACPTCGSYETRSVRLLHAQASGLLKIPTRTSRIAPRRVLPVPDQDDLSFFAAPPVPRDAETPAFAAWLCAVLAPLLMLFALQGFPGLWAVISVLAVAAGLLRHLAERSWTWNSEHLPRLQAAWARIHRCQRCSTVFETAPVSPTTMREP